MTITEISEKQEIINQVKEVHSKGQQLFAGMLVNFHIDFGATNNVIPMALLNANTQRENTE